MATATDLTERLYHYRDLGPGTDWSRFLQETASLERLRSIGLEDAFTLGVMRLAVLRQMGKVEEGVTLIPHLQAWAEQGRLSQQMVLAGESVRLYLLARRDQEMMQAALQLMNPPCCLDPWTKAYVHSSLAHLHLSLWSDEEAAHESSLAVLPPEVPARHAFAFVYNSVSHRLNRSWLGALDDHEAALKAIAELQDILRHISEKGEGLELRPYAETLLSIMQGVAGQDITFEYQPDGMESLPNTYITYLRGRIVLAEALQYVNQEQNEQAHVLFQTILDSFVGREGDSRALLFQLELMLPFYREHQQRYPDMLMRLLDMHTLTLQQVRQRGAAAFALLVKQAREANVAQAARGQLVEELEEHRRDLERSHRDLVARLAHVAEYRDDQTGGHVARVARMTTRLARHLGYTQKDARELGDAARLHDLGKVSLPDSILLKPGMLTAQEREAMQRHTKVGAEILKGASGALALAHDVALYHHERWDGEGYPMRLKGDAIPLCARIVAVADVFDTLLSARPYKEPWTREQALAEMHRMAGSQFDPQVIEALDKVMVDMEQATRW